MKRDVLTNFSIKNILLNKITLTIFSLAAITAIALFVHNYGKINIDDATIISTHENIFSKIEGNIFEIPVKEGDTVNQGDLLVKIYPAKYELRLKKFQSSKIQAEQELSDFETVLEKRSAELDIAKKDCDRNQSMFDEKIATKEDFDRSINEMQNSNFSYLGAKKDVEDAKNKLAIILSEVEQAKIDLENTKILAPENGQIESIFVSKSENINKDRLLLSINANRLIIVIPKKQAKFVKIESNQPVTIKLKNSSAKISGKIDKVLLNDDFKDKESLAITENSTILSVQTDKDFSNEIDGFQNIKMSINIRK